jgi:hypothetical protein
MFNNIAASLSSHDCSYCSSSQQGGILRAGRKAWSRSPPPTSTNPTPISTTGASTVRGARRSALRHGQLNSPTQVSFRGKNAFFSRTIKKEQAKPYALNPANGHEFVEWWTIMWPQNDRGAYLSLCRCDRILWRGKGLKQVQYETCSYRLSDHRPVRAVFHAECDVLSETEGMVQK